MSFPRYGTYKESDVDWLGHIPTHWTSSPLKHVADFINGAAFKPDEWAESGFPIIRIQNLNGGGDFNFFDGDVEERYLVHDGDLLFGWSGNRGTSFGPFLWRDGRVCVLNQHIFRVVPHILDRQSLFWILKAVTFHVEDQAHGIIGMVHVTKSDLGAIQVPIPPEQEAARIAEFLNRETAKIDALVTEQRRLMELLKEKRQAVISHVVTKGLNPDAPMQDSGIEWLGEVPAHWRLQKFKHLASAIEQGWSPQCESFPADDDNSWGVLKVGCVNGGTFNSAENKALPRELEPIPSLSIYRGDLLISRANTQELVGSAAVPQRDYPRLMFSDKLYRIRLRYDNNPGFASYYLGSIPVRSQIQLQATGASDSMLNIGQAAILELPIPTPARQEQDEIVAFVQEEQRRLMSLVQETQRAINLLLERRTALIFAAVTGQIDVRNIRERRSAA